MTTKPRAVIRGHVHSMLGCLPKSEIRDGFFSNIVCFLPQVSIEFLNRRRTVSAAVGRLRGDTARHPRAGRSGCGWTDRRQDRASNPWGDWGVSDPVNPRDNGHYATAFLVRVANLLDWHVCGRRGGTGTVEQWRRCQRSQWIIGQRATVVPFIDLFVLATKQVEKTDGNEPYFN